MWELWLLSAFYLRKIECLALTMHISGAVRDVMDWNQNFHLIFQAESPTSSVFDCTFLSRKVEIQKLSWMERSIKPNECFKS